MTARFREIEITLSEPAALANWPQSWLRVEVSPSIARFVETRYNDEQTGQQIQALFPAAQNVSVNPMPLREIFVALAKSRRKAA